MPAFAKAVGVVASAALVLSAYFVFTQTTPAPDVKFMTIGGESINTADLRGRVVLVNFWATSCETCVKEMPRLVETHRRFAGRGFETIAVAMSYDPPNYVLAYVQRAGLPFPVALDADGAVARGFGDVRLTPTSFLIDRRGRIVQRYLGEPDFGRLRALVEELLRQPA
ncbi:MAG: TlpA family protein disulfide reductase [Betaproteobacteria bacterium]|nr:TlpA family protein disulfide reductase [Betaproteobacteria bacterium]